jgi:hypothetical protein
MIMKFPCRAVVTRRNMGCRRSDRAVFIKQSNRNLDVSRKMMLKIRGENDLWHGASINWKD